MKPLWMIACILLSGCSWIGRQADALGSYMPVIGERCEHWQCIGEEGQAISNAHKEQDRLREEKEKAAEEEATAKANKKPFPTQAPQ